MQIVRCLIAQDDMEQATEEYFLLCRIDPLISLDMIPLPWFVSVETKKGTRAREKTAEDWLDPLQTKHRGPAATLLAASILSVSGNQSKQNLGKQYLKNLASLYDTNTAEQMKAKNKSDLAAQRQQEAARLAGALLWKERIPRLKTASDLTPLRRYLEQIPEAQRAGPLFLFGLAARRTDQLEDAVLAWMRIPISYRENRPLAVEALREAAQTLEKLGRTDQAETLRREAETLSK